MPPICSCSPACSARRSEPRRMIIVAFLPQGQMVRTSRISSVSSPRAANRRPLPKHLPCVEEVIGPELTGCGCGGGLHRIGEGGEPLAAIGSRTLASDRLEVIPAQFRVIVTRRPNYACRSCSNGAAQAPAPARLIPGGMPTEVTVAHVLVCKGRGTAAPVGPREPLHQCICLSSFRIS